MSVTTNLQTFSEIAALIKDIEYSCGKEGLQMSYEYNGKEQHLAANLEQSADLLKTVGCIDDYAGSGDDVAVEVEMSNGRIVQTHWDNFVTSFDLSLLDAIRIAAILESNKQIAPYVRQFQSIPSLVKQIGRA